MRKAWTCHNHVREIHLQFQWHCTKCAKFKKSQLSSIVFNYVKQPSQQFQKPFCLLPWNMFMDGQHPPAKFAVSNAKFIVFTAPTLCALQKQFSLQIFWQHSVFLQLKLSMWHHRALSLCSWNRNCQRQQEIWLSYCNKISCLLVWMNPSVPRVLGKNDISLFVNALHL